MSTTSIEKRWNRRGTALAAAIAVLTFAGAASAGECPADKRVPDGQGQKMVSFGAKGVTDVVRSMTDLSREPANIAGRQFRLRQLDVEPGGIVPWHSHDNRPAMIYMVSGEIVEYASNCAVPIMHKAGDVAPERAGISHWWENKSNSKAVLISVDLFPVEAMKDQQHLM